jgi:hypothetical protein
MHYKIRANVYKFLGRGVVGSCFGVYFLSLFFFGGGGRKDASTFVNLLWLHSSSVLVKTRVRLL